MKLAYRYAIGLLLGGAVLIQACGGDDNPTPGDDDDDDSFIPPEGGSPNVDDGGTGGGAPAGTGGTFEVPDRPACPATADGTQPAGSPIEGTACWKLEDCNGTQKQFLERCSGTCLAPFDNDDRIEGFTGTLPPL